MWNEVLLFLFPFRRSNFWHVNLAYLQKCSLYSGERSVPLGALVEIADLQKYCIFSKYDHKKLFYFLAHLSRRLEWAIVIAHRPSSVRLSVRPSSVRPSIWRKLFTFSTSSPEPLDRFWWNLVCMKYSWSLTSVVVFRQDPPRGGSRAGQKWVTGVPFFKKLLLQTGRLQRQTECIAMT